MKIVNTTIEENYLIVWDEDDNILEIPVEEFENWVEYYDRTEWVYYFHFSLIFESAQLNIFLHFTGIIHIC